MLLLAEAGLLQAAVAGADVIQERYVFYLTPLAGIAFFRYAARGWPHRVAHLVLAAGLLLVSLRVPLSGVCDRGYASTARRSSTASTGWAVSSASVGAASAVVAGSGRRALGDRRAGDRGDPALGTPLALGLAMLVTGAASAGAVAFDVTNTGLAKRAFLPDDPSWVDRAHCRARRPAPGLGRHPGSVAPGALLEPLDRSRPAAAGGGLRSTASATQRIDGRRPTASLTAERAGR